MQQTRLLLIGKNGQVGWELQRTLQPLGTVVAVDYPEIDLGDGESLRRWIRDTAPQVVLNAAAFTDIDAAESKPDFVQRINGHAPGLLAEEAKRLGALLVHFSSDMVFDGNKNMPYEETDQPKPLNAYGRAKLAGDLAIQQSGVRHLLFRLGWVYGRRRENSFLHLLRQAREPGKLRVARDLVSTPTWCRLVAEATALALMQVFAAGDLGAFNGLYHLSAEGSASHHRFAEEIVLLMRPDQRRCSEIEAVLAAELPTLARRAPFSVLCCDKLENTFGLFLPRWEESLKVVMEEI